VLNQSVEEKAAGIGSSSIKAKRILVKVVIQMFFTYGPLMCPHQPAFQQGGYTMNTGQSYMGWIT
jgi:hypothetical protein